MTLISVLLARFHKIQVTGPVVAAFFAVAGYSFFGKNLYNSIPIILGVYLYAFLMKKPYAQYIMISLFGSALSPVISYITFGMGLPLYLGASLGYLSGIIIGSLLPIVTFP